MDYLEKFNQTFREFSTDLIRVFPEDQEFQMYHLAVNAAMMINPRICVDVFRAKVVQPYGEKILAKDDTFFLSHDYTDLKETHDEASDIINKVKMYWADMSTENRDIVWKYFKVLVLLCQKISI